MENEEVMSPQEFLIWSKAMDIDLVQLKDFILKSELNRKLVFFSAWKQEELLNKISNTNQNEKKPVRKKGNITKLEMELIGGEEYFNRQNVPKNTKVQIYFPVEKLINFFLQLIDSSHISCKVLLNYNKNNAPGEDAFAEFLPLDIKPQFDEILKKSISVLFTGGTMEPKGYLQVLATPKNPNLSEEKLKLMEKANAYLGYSEKKSELKKPKIVVCRSFDHVVDPQNIFLDFVSSYENTKFKFTFENMNNGAMFKSLCRLIFRTYCSVEGGVIVFLPSYAFLKKLKSSFVQLYSKERQIQDSIFFDEKTQSNAKASTKNAFERFKITLQNDNEVYRKQRALLFSVMGGSLSEGINFKDNLARCILVVGQPYPSLKSSNLKAKMDYFSSEEFSSKYLSGLTTTKSSQRFSSQEYYESICIKKVNQTIGRAIRHKNDWASILMVDSRYSERNWKVKLPPWIMRGYQGQNSGNMGGNILKKLSEWFERMNK